MKNWKKGITVLLTLVFCLTSFSELRLSTNQSSEGLWQAAITQSGGRLDIPTKVQSEKLGSFDNPFLLLEIVPNQAMAQMGYLIGGQEPTDLAAVEAAAKINNTAGKQAKDALNHLETTLGMIEKRTGSESDNPEDNKPEDNKPVYKFSGETFPNDSDYIWTEQGDKKTQYGYFKKVEEGKGDYKQEILTEEYVEVGNGNGDFIKKQVYDNVNKNKAYDRWDVTSNSWYVVFKGKKNEKGVDTYNAEPYATQPSEGEAQYYITENRYNPTDTNVNKQNYYIGINNQSTLYFTYAPDGNGKYIVEFEKKREKIPNSVRTQKHIGSMLYKFITSYGYAGSNQGNYKRKTTCNYTNVGEGNGDYIWAGNRYEENQLSGIEKPEDELGADRVDTSIEQTYYVGVKRSDSAFANTELFKKYSIGLVYRDNDIKNGFDTQGYDFMGWYTDKNKVNRFDFSKPLFEDAALYAKWRTRTADTQVMKTYELKFDANRQGEMPLVNHMPLSIFGVEEGETRLHQPDALPAAAGYRFGGWYLDSGCSEDKRFVFSTTGVDGTETASTTIKADMADPNQNVITLYAKWEALSDLEGFYVQFLENKPRLPEEGLLADVKNMPLPVTNLPVENNGVLKPSKNPSLYGYQFEGWYESEICSGPAFAFADSENEEASRLKGSISLYAKWSKEETPLKSVKVGFNVDKPESAIDSVVFGAAQVVGEAGKTIEPPAPPKLTGNVPYKIKEYHIKVVTVDPAVFKNDDKSIESYNLSVIDRADLIVMNQTDDALLRKLMGGYPNKALFSKLSTTDASTFSQKDLSWDSAVRILKKVSVSKNICPVIFDYAAYATPVKNTTIPSLNKTYMGGETTELTAQDTLKGSNNNVYKLYLMTQQFNPVMFYNAFFRMDMIASNGNYIAQTGNAQTYWNEYTLLPFEVLKKSEDDYRLQTKWDPYEILLKLPEEPGLRHNSYIYKNDSTGSDTILSGFVSKQRISEKNAEEAFAYFKDKQQTEGKLSSAQGVYYLLRTANSIVSQSKDINILEIQPSPDFGSKVYWYWYICRYIDNYTGVVTVTNQVTNEFVASIEDLNSTYDLIYMGLNKVQSEFNMVTNDYGDYYRYVHVGNKVTAQNYNRTGVLGLSISQKNQDWTVDHYYSGNDITKRKKSDLLNYAKAGYPVLFAKDFFVDGPGGKTSPNTSYVDNSSYVYDFANDITAAEYKHSFFREDKEGDKKPLSDALLKVGVELHLLKKPTEYKERTLEENEHLSEEEIYTNPGNVPGSASLKFTFSFNTDKEAEGLPHEVRLFVDTNGDGRYDETEERLDGLEVYDEGTGRIVKDDKLVANKQYKVIRGVSEYVGIMPWKLEVVRKDKPNVRDNRQGMASIKSTKKTELLVLQIDSRTTTDSGGNSTVQLPTDKEIENQSFGNTGKQFWEYTKGLDEFSISFERKTVNEFKSYINSPDNTLEKYNMLIIGFADAFQDISDEKSLVAIEDFIDKGKAVLFTHDTTSFVNKSSKAAYNKDGKTFSEWYWGFHINFYFREVLGMDRYGATISGGDPEKAKLPGMEKKDKPYKPGTEQKSVYTSSGGKQLLQGFTNADLNTVSTYTTTNVEKLNNGQITHYPYLIQDLTVANTHAQYYQLDLESEDIVVWYTLAAPGNAGHLYSQSGRDARNNYYIYNKGNITYSGVGHSGGLTDNEVKLFVNTMIAAYRSSAQASIPMVTNRDKSSRGNDDFLYIDYDAVESGVAIGDEIETKAEESSIFPGINLQTKVITFMLTNNSVVTNKKMTVHFYPVTYGEDGKRVVNWDDPIDEFKIYEYDDGVKAANPVVTKGVNFTYQDKPFTNQQGSLVESGQDYMVEIPVNGNITGEKNNLIESDRMEFEMVTVMQYGKNQDQIKVASKALSLIRRGIFEID